MVSKPNISNAHRVAPSENVIQYNSYIRPLYSDLVHKVALRSTDVENPCSGRDEMINELCHVGEDESSSLHEVQFVLIDEVEMMTHDGRGQLRVGPDELAIRAFSEANERAVVHVLTQLTSWR